MMRRVVRACSLHGTALAATRPCFRWSSTEWAVKKHTSDNGTHHLSEVLREIAAHYGRHVATWTLDDLIAAGNTGVVLCRFDDCDTRVAYDDASRTFYMERGTHHTYVGVTVRCGGAFLERCARFFAPVPRNDRNKALRDALLCGGARAALVNDRSADDRHPELWPGKFIETGGAAEKQDLQAVNIVVGPTGAGKTAFAQEYLWKKAAAEGVSVMVASALSLTPDEIRERLLETLRKRQTMDLRDMTEPCEQPIVDRLFVVLDEFTVSAGPGALQEKLAGLHGALVEAMPCCKLVTLCVVGTGLMHEAAHIKSNEAAGGIIKFRLLPWAPDRAWQLISCALDSKVRQRCTGRTPPTLRWNPSAARYAKALAALALHQQNTAVEEHVAAHDPQNLDRNTVALLTQLWATPRAALVCAPLLVSAAGSRWHAEEVALPRVVTEPSLWTVGDWRYMLRGPEGSGTEGMCCSYLAALDAVASHSAVWVEHAVATCFGLNGLSSAGEVTKRRVARTILQVASTGFMHPSGRFRTTATASSARTPPVHVDTVDADVRSGSLPGAVDVEARTWAVRCGMLVQEDAAESGEPRFSVAPVGLLTALLIARITLPRATVAAERLKEASLVMVAAVRFVARSTSSVSPDVRFAVTAEPNAFAPGHCAMWLNARDHDGGGPQGVCGTVAVHAIKPPQPCRPLLSSAISSSTVSEFAVPPKTSTLVVVSTHQEVPADFAATCRPCYDCEVVFIGRGQAMGWSALLGISEPAPA